MRAGNESSAPPSSQASSPAGPGEGAGGSSGPADAPRRLPAWQVLAAVLVTVVAGTWLFWPALDMGFHLDDFLHLAAVQGEEETPEAGTLELFTFAEPVEEGKPQRLGPIQGDYLPWWRADDLLMVLVPDQQNLISLLRIPQRLKMHLGHERARRVNRRQIPSRCLRPHRRRHAVGAKNNGRSLWRFIDILDKSHAPIAKPANDMLVVHDLVVDIQRFARAEV